MYTTYILYSPAFNKIYIGYTSDLNARLLSHNVLSTKGWTTRFRPWVIVHTETFSQKPDAMKREKELKTAAGRKWIWKTLIK
jgi:putative endonuclease